jgi:TolB-like protein/class 3 adenylate cyclase/Tfp pilus assembly protein PilF
MPTQEVKRKLAAILSADVKGYSRLIRDDELGTIRTLNAYKELMTNLIQKHHGRVVDAPGDNLLAEFGSVVDAVECSVEIQKELKTRNGELPENRRMEFRIGINLGDVVEDGEQILGDGVNIAARLEGLSDPGGICISGVVYDQIKIKLNLGYEYLGEHTVKNIAEPIRVYRVLMEPEAAGKVIGEKKVKPRTWQMATIGLAIGLIAVIAAIVIWKLYTPPALQPEVASKEKITVAPSEKPPVTVPTSPAPSIETTPKEKVTPLLPEKVAKPIAPPAPKVEVASKEKMAFPLPDKPSIAVLPFTNMSGEKELEYFSDGLAEGIINGLSKSEHIFVIARNSTFTYKGKPVKVKQVAEEMGVRYVIEGSVQQEGNRVRITVQLIDALTGRHLFSEQYNRDLKDILNLQDEITLKVLTAVQVKLTTGEVARVYEKGTKNLEAYLKVLQAREFKGGTLNKERVERAMQLLEEAIALDPEYAYAYSILCTAHFDLVIIGASQSPRDSLQRAVELGEKAIALDDSNSSVHASLTFPYLYIREFDKAISEAEKAISLSPNSATAYWALGTALSLSGRPQEAIPMLQKSLRLSPIPVHSQVLGLLAHSYSMLGQYEEAIATYKKVLQFYGPDHLMAHIGLAGAYASIGRENEARAEGAEVLRIDPKFSLERFIKALPYNQSTKDRLAEVLRKAGLK